MFNEFKDHFLEGTNSKGVMTRPIWTLMNNLSMYKDAQCYNLKNSNWLSERVVNIPSKHYIMNKITLISGQDFKPGLVRTVEWHLIEAFKKFYELDYVI